MPGALDVMKLCLTHWPTAAIFAIRERAQIVKINNNYSHSLSVISGVRRGSVLGRTLLLLHINDLCDLFADLSVYLKLYADDIKLCSHCDVSSSCDLDSAID